MRNFNDDALQKVQYSVEPFEGLEEDIRARYNAWCESTEIISY